MNYDYCRKVKRKYVLFFFITCNNPVRETRLAFKSIGYIFYVYSIKSHHKSGRPKRNYKNDNNKRNKIKRGRTL